MMETLAQHAYAAALAAVVVLALLVLAIARALRRRPRKQVSTVAAAEPAVVLDRAALVVAVAEAETAGQLDRLPALHLSLAHCHLETGEVGEAEALLLRSIRGAAHAKHRHVHAQARLALGDLAHASGDLTTACEHWQIARALFHELKLSADHKAVETRMLRNGCPTDWVLTDF